MRHAPRRDKDGRELKSTDESLSEIELVAEEIGRLETGKRLAILASPELFAYRTARSVQNYLAKHTWDIKLGVPKGTFNFDPYIDHPEVSDVPFPLFGLSEWTTGGGHEFVSMPELMKLFPYFVNAIKPIDEAFKRREIDRKTGQERATKILDGFLNPEGDINPVLSAVNALEDKVDSLLLVTHSSICGNLDLKRRLTKNPGFNQDALGGLDYLQAYRFDFKQQSVDRLGIKPSCVLLEKLPF